jgi:hypothetical protein
MHIAPDLGSRAPALWPSDRTVIYLALGFSTGFPQVSPSFPQVSPSFPQGAYVKLDVKRSRHSRWVVTR